MTTKRFSKNDVLLLCGLALIGVLVGIGDLPLADRIGLLFIGQALIALCGVALLLEAQRTRLSVGAEQLQRQMNNFRQLESLISINMFLSPSVPLPSSGGWAASADFLKLIVEVCVRNRPIHILEASSGLSTLVCAYTLKRLGLDGKVFSLEHDSQYAEQNKRLVEEHGLQHFVSIIYAPLTECVCSGDNILWYDISKLPSNISIDLFVVDGPPADIRRDIRRPAVPLFFDRLSDGGVVLLDDAGRLEEQEIIKRWLRDYPKLKYSYFAFEKGAAMLTKCNRE